MRSIAYCSTLVGIDNILRAQCYFHPLMHPLHLKMCFSLCLKTHGVMSLDSRVMSHDCTH